MFRNPVLARTFAPVLALAGLCALAASAQQAPVAATPSPVAAPAAPKKRHVTHHDRIRAQQAFIQGARDLERDQPRAALAAFLRAAQFDPSDSRYSASISVARQRLVHDLVQQADQAKFLGHLDESRADIQEAYRLAPDDPLVAQHVDELAAAAAAHAPGTPQFSTALAQPIELHPRPGRRSFHIHTNERTLIDEVFAAWGVHPTIDQSVGTAFVPYDIDDADFAQTESTLALATNTFFVPLDPVRVLVAKDSRENRAIYEREAMETFYLTGLSNEDQTEMANLAREDFAAKTAFADPGDNALTVRAPVSDLEALNGTLQGLLQGRSSIELDVVMYEVDRTNANMIGAILPTQTSLFNVYSEASSILQQNSSLVQEIISSGLAQPGQWEQILAILLASGEVSNSLFSNGFGVFGGGLTMTGVTYSGGTANLELNSSDVHSVDQMQLRVLDREEGVIKVGERYPIITSEYGGIPSSSLNIPGLSSSGLSSTLQNLGISASALESLASEEIPQIQYQDLGLTLDVTPHLLGPHGLSLKLDLKLTALAGASYNGLPALDQREYQAINSLNIGESTVLLTALNRQQSVAVTGIPGLNDLPGFADATNRNSNLNYSELAIVITPHIVRLTHQQAEDKMFLVPPAQ
jgi:general secretion pathway protein D